MTILWGTNVLKEIADCAEKSTTVMIAAPYWGTDAIERLRLKKATSADSHQLICNLESGACNPKPIKALKNDLKWKVHTNPRLHAKVYLFDADAIVGSANPSSNGLCDDATSREGWHEVCIKITDQSSIKQLRNWFSRACQPPQATIVGDHDLDIATKHFNANQADVRNNRIKIPKDCLTNLLKGDEADWWLSNLKVWIYNLQDVSPETEAYAKEINCEAYEVLSDPKKWRSTYNPTIIDCCFEIGEKGLIKTAPMLYETFPDLSGEVKKGIWCLPAKPLGSTLLDKTAKNKIIDLLRSKPPQKIKQGIDWELSLKQLFEGSFKSDRNTIYSV